LTSACRALSAFVTRSCWRRCSIQESSGAGRRRLDHALDAEPPADRAGADRAQQQAVERRPAADLVARDQGQQRPVRAREHEEARRPDHGGAQAGIVARVAQAGAHEGLGRQRAAARRRRTPPDQRRDDAKRRRRIDPERPLHAPCANDDAGQRRRRWRCIQVPTLETTVAVHRTAKAV